MLSLTIRKSSPPSAFILLNLVVRILCGCIITKTEPEKGSPAMFFVLVVLSDVEIAIGVYLTAQSALLIIHIIAFINASFAINSHSDSVFLFCPNLSNVNFIFRSHQFAFCTHDGVGIDDL